MRSIRRHLAIRLTATLCLAWLASGLGLFLIVHHSQRSRFDAELELLASEVRFLLPEARFLRSEIEQARHTERFFVPGSGFYFEVWDADAIFSDRSPSLATMSLPRPARFDDTPKFWNARLPTGEPVRLIGVRQGMPLAMPTLVSDTMLTVHTVVARNRSELDRALWMLAAGIAAAGALLGLLSTILVIATLRTGLAPLKSLASQAALLGPENLTARFPPPDHLPSELHPIAGRLNGLIERIQEGFERERRFSANLAHELRTPVAELKMMSEVSMRWPEEADMTAFEDVYRVAGRMQSLVESLLALSRAEQDNAPIGSDPIDVNQLLDDGWRPLATQAARKKLTLKRELPRLFELNTSHDFIEVILNNLLANAVEYAPEGGAIDVRGERSRSGAFTLRVGNSTEALSHDDITHLFERTWRRDTSRSTSEHHGLGLSLARACADRLGFDLTATLLNNGTYIEFRLNGTA